MQNNSENECRIIEQIAFKTIRIDNPLPAINIWNIPLTKTIPHNAFEIANPNCLALACTTELPSYRTSKQHSTIDFKNIIKINPWSPLIFSCVRFNQYVLDDALAK